MAKLNDLNGKQWLQFTKSWVIVYPKSREKNVIKHPAKYPEELVDEFISFFTKKGDIVLDPFLGVGSTIVSAERNERIGVGIELNPEFAEISKKRCKDGTRILVGDVRNEIKKIKTESIDFIMTSPPYWDILSKKRGNSDSQHGDRLKSGLQLVYSDEKQDLSNISNYDEFLNELSKIFNRTFRVLKKDKYMVIVVQNFRNNDGKYITLAWDLEKKLEKKWKFVGEKIWIQENKKLGIWGYPTTFVPNIHHHYCLIFKKEN